MASTSSATRHEHAKPPVLPRATAEAQLRSPDGRPGEAHLSRYYLPARRARVRVARRAGSLQAPPAPIAFVRFRVAWREALRRLAPHLRPHDCAQFLQLRVLAFRFLA